MHEDILDTNRVSIMFDVISREGFEFSVIELHSILAEGCYHLLPDIDSLLLEYTDDSASHGYCVLVWGCSSDGGKSTETSIFAQMVHEYYEHIGDMEYYRGLLDA